MRLKNCIDSVFEPKSNSNFNISDPFYKKGKIEYLEIDNYNLAMIRKNKRGFSHSSSRSESIDFNKNNGKVNYSPKKTFGFTSSK